MLEQVYAIQFSSGAVKVGRTKDFGRRLAEHTKHAQPHGVTVVDSWNACVDDAYTAEIVLHNMARDLGGVRLAGNPEWFADPDFEEFTESAACAYSDFETQLAEEDARLHAQLRT